MATQGSTGDARWVARGATGLVFGTLLSGLIRGRLGMRRGDHGATAVEYALMVSLIAVVIVASVLVFGRNVSALFNVPTSALAP